jgi:hypothetical protein
MHISIALIYIIQRSASWFIIQNDVVLLTVVVEQTLAKHTKLLLKHESLDTMVVQPGQHIQITFITSEVDHHKPSLKSLHAHGLLFIPRFRKNPQILNIVARRYYEYNRRLWFNRFRTWLKRYSRRNTPFSTKRAFWDTKMFGPKRKGFWAAFQRGLYRGWTFFDPDRVHTMREIDYLMDDSQAVLDGQQVQMVHRADGRWNVHIRIRVPNELASLDPTYFESQVVLVSRGMGGAVRLLGKSLQVLRCPRVEKQYQLSFPHQLEEYRFEVVQDVFHTSFLFKLPPNAHHVRTQSELKALNALDLPNPFSPDTRAWVFEAEAIWTDARMQIRLSALEDRSVEVFRFRVEAVELRRGFKRPRPGKLFVDFTFEAPNSIFPRKLMAMDDQSRLLWKATLPQISVDSLRNVVQIDFPYSSKIDLVWKDYFKGKQ